VELLAQAEKDMKIIFLDIDGVLNSLSSHMAVPANMGKLYSIDADKVAMLDRIVFETGARLVISSSWRHSWESLGKIASMVGEFIDITPYRVWNKELKQNASRGSEIDQWLATWYAGSDDKITHYAILDDDTDMLEGQLPNFFRTTWEEGLNEEVALKVIAHLNK
jgi:hypothetical protein